MLGIASKSFIKTNLYRIKFSVWNKFQITPSLILCNEDIKPTAEDLKNLI